MAHDGDGLRHTGTAPSRAVLTADLFKTGENRTHLLLLGI